jgi:hypothetical protein
MEGRADPKREVNVLAAEQDDDGEGIRAVSCRGRGWIWNLWPNQGEALPAYHAINGIKCRLIIAASRRGRKNESSPSVRY